MINENTIIVIDEAHANDVNIYIMFAFIREIIKNPKSPVFIL